ncbi:MAG: universal stress protein [Desulfobacterales bacterium]|nr:universal stress protein [Desulfobacterales bacterium]MBF0395623.1 universal stress protein [Desulfobacterales bacterium]
MLDFFINMELCAQDVNITLIHVFRKPSSGEELMGQKFMKELPTRFTSVLQKAKDRLVEKGYIADKIETKLIEVLYPTISDGIIDEFNKKKYDMVVIGRKRMSKAEEFVLGDPSAKLVRALNGTAVLVVKCK